MNEVDELLADPTLTMPLREELLAEAWVSWVDRGAERALTVLSSTMNPEAVALAAGYLTLLPGLREEKGRVVAALAPRKGDWARGIVDLIRFLSASAANDLLHDTLQTPDDPSAVSVLFEIATYFPWLVQPYVGTIDDPLIEEAMLPGGPDEWAYDFVRRFRDSEDPVFLQALVRMRTEASRRELEALRATSPSRMWPALDASIENCGFFRDTGEESYYPKPRLGFVVELGTAPHRLGGGFAGHLPHCEFCFTPTAHVLSLAAGEVGMELERDPSFFWFQCQHHDRDEEPLFVRLTNADAERLVVIELGDPVNHGIPLMPADLALALEDHPNQIGVGRDRVPRRGLHGVGGPPNWCHIDSFPRCPVCSRGMRYIAAIDGGMTPFGPIRVPGTLFMFWCDPCAVSATRLQR